MRKRWESILALMLAGVVVFGGCGQKTTDTDNTDTEESDVQTEEEEEEGVQPISLVLNDIQENDFNYEKSYVSVNYVAAALHKNSDMETYPELVEALEGVSAAKDESYYSMLDRLKEAAADLDTMYSEDDSDSAYTDDYGAMTDEHTMYVMRSDSVAVSLLDFDYYYEYPGAHPFYEYSAVNLDAQTGKKIALSEVVTDQEAFLTLLKEKLQEQYPEDYADFEIDTVFSDMESSFDGILWTLDSEGVTVYFNVYELGTYAAGAQIINVSYGEAADLFNDSWFETPDSYVIPLLADTTRKVDIAGDGSPVEVALEDEVSYGEYDDSDDDGVEDVYQSYYKTSIIIDGETIELSQESMYGDRYLVRANDQYYLYIFQEFDSDWSNLVIFDLSSREEKGISDDVGMYTVYTYEDEEDLVYRYVDTIYPFIDTEDFLMGSGTYLMGTVDGYRSYYVDSEGVPASSDSAYSIESTIVMHTLDDISCELVDEDGNVTGEGTIPADSYVRYVRTDNETYTDLQVIVDSYVENTNTENENYHYYQMKNYVDPDFKADVYRIYVERDEDTYENIIDGRPETEVLEGVVYVG